MNRGFWALLAIGIAGYFMVQESKAEDEDNSVEIGDEGDEDFEEEINEELHTTPDYEEAKLKVKKNLERDPHYYERLQDIRRMGEDDE